VNTNLDFESVSQPLVSGTGAPNSSGTIAGKPGSCHCCLI